MFRCVELSSNYNFVHLASWLKLSELAETLSAIRAFVWAPPSMLRQEDKLLSGLKKGSWTLPIVTNDITKRHSFIASDKWSKGCLIVLICVHISHFLCKPMIDDFIPEIVPWGSGKTFHLGPFAWQTYVLYFRLHDEGRHQGAVVRCCSGVLPDRSSDPFNSKIRAKSNASEELRILFLLSLECIAVMI